jgi:hypothetical protein
VFHDLANVLRHDLPAQERTEKGRKVGEIVASWRNRQMIDDFLLGERYLKDAAASEAWLSVFPFRDIPAQYVVVKPIEQVDPARDDVKSITFFVDADRLSALVILANVTIPWERFLVRAVHHTKEIRKLLKPVHAA